MSVLDVFPSERQLHLADTVAHKLKVDGLLEFADLRQDALVGMWQFHTRFRDGYGDRMDEFHSACYMMGRRAAIDGVRQRHGRTGTLRSSIVMVPHNPPPSHGSADSGKRYGFNLNSVPDRAPAVEDLAGIGVRDIYTAAKKIVRRTKDPRLLYIVHRLQQGATKDAVARELHLSAGRITHLITPLKRSLEQMYAESA